MNESPAVSQQSVEPFLAHLPVAAVVVRQTRVLAANERLCALLGRRMAELMDASDPLHFLGGGDGDTAFARHVARSAGKSEPDEYDLDLRARDGSRIPARARISEFPPAGPGAFLVLLTDERGRSRAAERVRAFVDVAVSAQRETTRNGVFRLVQDRLSATGLTVTVTSIEGDQFELVAFGGPPHAGIVALRERWPGKVPMDVFREQVYQAHLAVWTPA